MDPAAAALTSIPVTSLQRVASGKVRDVFALPGDLEDGEGDNKTLLFVASDRTSAYDVVLANGVPGKGVVLTQLSAYWFSVLQAAVPGLRTHLVSRGVPRSLRPRLSPAERDALRGRAMRVRRVRIFPVEAIVRGYLAGSAWAEYAARGTMHGEPLPAGLQQCARLPAPVFTPSTKAEAGAHDENISRAAAAALIGDPAHAARVEELALAAYSAAAAHALARGIIIADTKFEFGLLEETGEVVLADEVLTPDSSRFWPADRYEPGRDQPSFDKQFIRNWLTREGLKGKEGVAMPDDVVRATADRYREAFTMLTGKTVEDSLREEEQEEEEEAAE